MRSYLTTVLWFCAFFIFSIHVPATLSCGPSSFKLLSSSPRRANYNLNHHHHHNKNRRTSTARTVINDKKVASADDSSSFSAGFYSNNNNKHQNEAVRHPFYKCGRSRYYYQTSNIAVEPSSSIVGGLAAFPHEFPWIARIQIINPSTNSTHLCSANIVSDFFLLTAAHCVAEVARSPKSVIAVIGEHDLSKQFKHESENKWVVAVTRIYIHPNYSAVTNDNDISLIKVAKNVLRNVPSHAENSSHPICLPQTCDDDDSGCGAGVTATIAGWGATSETVLKASKVLQKAKVPIISSGTCSKAFEKLGQKITSEMICAGSSVGGIDSCFGDSGGPLMTMTKSGYFQLCGVTSFGDGCGKAGIYGVYSRICTVSSWIKSVISSSSSSTED